MTPYHPDPAERCATFLAAIADVCAEHRVMMLVDDMMPWDCVEFIEKSSDPTGVGFVSSADDVAETVRDRFVEMHGLQASI